MSRPRTEHPQTERPWSVPIVVNEVPESGRHVELVADEQTRAAVAKLAQLRDLPRLQAAFDLARHGRDGLRVAGHLSATVGQTCVVTLDPIENEVEEDIDLVFTPGAAPLAGATDEAVEVTEEDVPEPLVGGAVDLGVIATEFLILGIDPYPRKPGAVFEAPSSEDDSDHPFAALAALRKKRGGQ